MEDYNKSERINRLREIDIAKGYGIILVIMGHILTEGSFREWIYSFHMPLFFFLAGAVVSLGPLQDIYKKKDKGNPVTLFIIRNRADFF